MFLKSTRSRVDYWHSVNQILVIFGVGLSSGIYGPSLIDLAEIYHSTPDDIAIMNSARAVGMFLGSCLGGFFFARMNDQILMILTLIVYGAGTVLIPLLPNLTYLYIVGFVAGTSVGVSHIGSQVRLVKIWPEQSASAIQAFHTAYGVGAMVGPFVGAPFLSERENDLVLKLMSKTVDIIERAEVYWADPRIGLTILLRVGGADPEETQLHIPYAAFGILSLLIVTSMIGAYCVDSSGIDETKDENHHKDGHSIRTLEIILMTLLFIYLFVCCTGECTFSTLISVYAVGSPDLQFSKPEAAYLAGIFWTTFTGGRILSILIAVFFDVKQLLIISHSIVVFASGLLIIFNSSTLCTWVGVAIMGLGVSSLYGSASGLVFQYLHVRHFHVSVILAASCLGIAFPAYFVPPIVEKWPMFLQYFTGLGNVIHFIVLLVLFQAIKGKQPIYSREANTGH